MEFHTIDRDALRHDPAQQGALDADGRLQVLPHAFWQQFSQAEIGNFCVQRGLYCIPTTELIDWLKGQIGDRRALEIGAGHGTLCAALGITGTDNWMQTWPEIAMRYRAVHQAPVEYGAHVEKCDAKVAIARHKPKLVVAAWVTHKYNPKEHWREGNQFGVEEKPILKVADYIHIGNRHVHRYKPILELEHEEYEFPWLVSRALNGAPNFIAVWRKR